MIDQIITLLIVAAAGLVMWRVVHVAASLDVHSFDGERWRFACLVCHWTLLGAGAVAVALGATIGGPMLLIAVALLMMSDRRSA